MYGKSADNIYISVPPGTLIRDADTGKIIKDTLKEQKIKV